MDQTPEFSVSGAIVVFNQILNTATPAIIVNGEVANYKVNQGKWVFFDLKDETGILSCFMPQWELRVQIENGMKVKVRAHPSVTKWGRFSLTVKAIQPVGEGAIKKSFELLKAKLSREGLFAASRKRPLPHLPEHIGVISSVEAAGYRDFIKIVTARMGGLRIDVISTKVQGETAADGIIAALKQFNESADPPEVLAILRGGGSRDDLVAFDDEKLARAIAASRVPVITGIGHEIDTTIADMVADRRASTPSNAAEIIVPDRRELIQRTDASLRQMVGALERGAGRRRDHLSQDIDRLNMAIDRQLTMRKQRLDGLSRTLIAYDPRAVLRRGYAIVWDERYHAIKQAAVGDKLTIETVSQLIETEVNSVTSK